jgi:transposase
MKQGVPLAIVNPNGTSSECPQCDFEADRDFIGKLNNRKRALKKLKIKVIPRGSPASPTAPQMTDVNPNRWGEPMNLQ